MPLNLTLKTDGEVMTRKAGAQASAAISSTDGMILIAARVDDGKTIYRVELRDASGGPIEVLAEGSIIKRNGAVAGWRAEEPPKRRSIPR